MSAHVDGLLLYTLDCLVDARRRQEETSARLLAALKTGDSLALINACHEEIGRLSVPTVTAEHVQHMRDQVKR